MIYDNTDYSNLIAFTKNGLQTASYTEIRSIITNRYKQIYGYDVDLSTGTADGQFIEMLSLMIHNMMLVTKSMYSSLNANTAQGKMLDIISNLTNVQRRLATYSRASVTVTNVSGSSMTLSSLDLIDKNGTLWTWTSDTPYEFADNVSESIIVQCSEVGPIKAPAGWITSTALNLAMTVEQSSDAIVGQDVETDEHLRARRNDSLASSGLTTLEAMKASLLNLDGIEDVFIINNDTTEDISANDGTTIAPHKVYVCIRKNESVEIADSSVGSMIYNKITPGIQTAVTDITADKKIYNFITGSGIQQNVNWRECTPVHPTIAITITSIDNYDAVNTPTIIKEAIAKYCNNLKINTKLISQDLFMKAIYADPKFKGQSTYTVNSVTINNASSYTNPTTYYDYDTTSITITDTNA